MVGMAMTIRPDAEMEAALVRLVAREGKSRQEILRSAVLERDQQTSLAEASQQMKERWAQVLDRLSKT